MRLTPAELLLLELGILKPADIDLEAIAAFQGVIVRYRVLSSSEARIIGANDRAVVTVDRRRGLPRARFSLAHELGHWHHHRGRTFICRSDDISGKPRGANDPERVADAYAADLVLPPFLVRDRVAGVKAPTLDAVRSLADVFQVSVTATAIRFVDFHAVPLILVRHGQAQRRWHRRNARIPGTWKLRDEVDHRSPSFNVLYGGINLSRPTRVKADLWFERRWADRHEVLEQSLRVADDEIITLLVAQDPAMLEF